MSSLRTTTITLRDRRTQIRIRESPRGRLCGAVPAAGEEGEDSIPNLLVIYITRKASCRLRLAKQAPFRLCLPIAVQKEEGAILGDGLFHNGNGFSLDSWRVHGADACRRKPNRKPLSEMRLLCEAIVEAGEKMRDSGVGFVAHV